MILTTILLLAVSVILAFVLGIIGGSRNTRQRIWEKNPFNPDSEPRNHDKYSKTVGTPKENSWLGTILVAWIIIVALGFGLLVEWKSYYLEAYDAGDIVRQTHYTVTITDSTTVTTPTTSTYVWKSDVKKLENGK